MDEMGIHQGSDMATPQDRSPTNLPGSWVSYVAFGLVLLFTLFAAWQWNDPDAAWWMAIYLSAAYASLQAGRRRFNLELLALLSAFYLAGMINAALQMDGWDGLMTPGAGLAMNSANQEYARELLGLGGCLAATGGYMALAIFHRAEHSPGRT